MEEITQMSWEGRENRCWDLSLRGMLRFDKYSAWIIPNAKISVFPLRKVGYTFRLSHSDLRVSSNTGTLRVPTCGYCLLKSQQSAGLAYIRIRTAVSGYPRIRDIPGSGSGLCNLIYVKEGPGRQADA
ncbi:hypothetical protein JTE90_026143 [Oedothorax gibbosus]|uniref:Uncharacterized protein n=1 Tax=Oedothorax gibbosus TaxID=931172 RepID=A0AAV6V1F2_9ARAC|nr:hypothetical protein JTE90_026143 [Oedothorax gibbosus]